MNTLMMAPHPDAELAFTGAPALTDKQMERIVDRLQFRPGWTIAFSKGFCTRSDKCYFHVVHTTQDVRDVNNPLTIMFCINCELGIYSEAQLIDAIGQSIRDIENHEFNEWFRYKGKPVTEPHPPGCNFR